VILLSRIDGLGDIEFTSEGLGLGAAVTLAAARPALAVLDPDLGGLVDRIGGRQIRSAATIGGNIASNPPGDLAPALMTLGASIDLWDGDAYRTIAADAFYQPDGRQLRAAGELIARVTIPRLPSAGLFRAYKTARRFDLAPSIVTGAFFFRLDEEGRIAEARIAFSGLDPGPQRAPETEAALTSAETLDRSMWARAFALLRSEFGAASQDRSDARYRIETSQAMLGKALIEAGGSPTQRTRLAGFRETADAAG
jgi:xanthine dehydrogenase small subunit